MRNALSFALFLGLLAPALVSVAFDVNVPAQAAPAVTGTAQAAGIGLHLPQDLFSHLHNKLVHFPVALGCLAALLIVLSYRWPQFEISVRLVLFLAAVGALASYVTGRGPSAEFATGPYSGVLEAHHHAAFFTLAWLWLGAVLSFIPWAKKIMWIYAGILVCLILATGFFGGLLATA